MLSLSFDCGSERLVYTFRYEIASYQESHADLWSSKQDSSADTAANAPSVPPPLNIPPSRARRTLAARLAQKSQDKLAEGDPDAADSTAVGVANSLSIDPPDVDLAAHAPGRDDDLEESGLQITGLRSLGAIDAAASASKFSGLFSSDSSSDDSSDIDEDDAGRDNTIARPEGDFEDDEGGYGSGLMMKRRDKVRRPSTTEAKERKPLDDDDDDGSSAPVRPRYAPGGGEGPFADSVHPDDDDDDDDDSSDDDGIVEIRTRRTS